MLLALVLAVCAGASGMLPLPRELKCDSSPARCFSALKIISVGHSCPMLTRAISRYSSSISPSPSSPSPSSFSSSFVLSVNVSSSSCPLVPPSSMDESYALSLDGSDGELSSPELWGALRGLETFSQAASGGCVSRCDVLDWPRFPHRGVLVDSARHFLPVDTLLSILDSMAASKLNVLHWHLVDSQSFPYEIRAAPALSSRGSYSPTSVYSARDVQRVVAYAADRGIRVLPEVDVPGHAASWGKGFPDAVAQCPPRLAANVNNVPLSPASNSSALNLVGLVLAQLQSDFADEFVHLGGDEVVTSCWTQDPAIAKWMQQQGLDASGTFNYFIDHIQSLVDASHTSIVWEESWRCCADSLSKSTVVDVWKDFGSSVGWRTLQDVVSSGRRAIVSYGWYLDHLDVDWKAMYAQEPFAMGSFSAEERALVLGGEASMWGEKVDAANWFERVYPRAFAVAERLWSAQNVTDEADMAARMTQHRCHLLARGFPVSPIAPGPPCNASHSK